MAISNEQLVAVLSALAPDKARNIREAFGFAAVDPTTVPGRVHFNEREIKRYSPSLRQLAEAKCPEWTSPTFKPKRWMEAAEVAVKQLREANSELALAFLLRKGVQTLANDWYIAYPRDWQDYALASPSNAFAEWYAPLYGSQIAGRVARGDRFPEGRIQGEDSVLVNQKFGLIEAFERELFDDDQTGQIRQRAQRLGQSMAQTENIYAAFRFIGQKQSYQNLTVLHSGYATTDVNGNATNDPWTSNLYGNYGNIPTTMTSLNINTLKRGYAQIIVAKDPFSNKVVVNPNVLIHSAMDSLHAPMLVQPPAGVPYYPAVIGAAGTTANTAASGFPGGVMGANPFMGIGIKPVLVRYLPDWAWAIGEKAKGFVFQERDPLEVIQENPLSGQAFEEDAYRFRSRRRFEADWVGGGSRFWWLGNSGTDASGNAISVGSTSNSGGVVVAGVAGSF